MDNLISGLIGAILATIITVAYSHIAELIRRRYDITLDTVAYCDEIYGHLQTMQVYKNRQATSNESLDIDEYKSASKQLRDLVISSQVHVRVALVYGQKSAEVRLLQTLRGHFFYCARLLWSANPNNWNEVNAALMSCMENQVDPLRAEIESRFVKSVKIKSILCDWLRGLLPKKNKSAGENKK